MFNHNANKKNHSYAQQHKPQATIIRSEGLFRSWIKFLRHAIAVPMEEFQKYGGALVMD